MLYDRAQFRVEARQHHCPVVPVEAIRGLPVACFGFFVTRCHFIALHTVSCELVATASATELGVRKQWKKGRVLAPPRRVPGAALCIHYICIFRKGSSLGFFPPHAHAHALCGGLVINCKSSRRSRSLFACATMMMRRLDRGWETLFYSRSTRLIRADAPTRRLCRDPLHLLAG